jgi:hypothetical protein
MRAMSGRDFARLVERRGSPIATDQRQPPSPHTSLFRPPERGGLGWGTRGAKRTTGLHPRRGAITLRAEARSLATHRQPPPPLAEEGGGEGPLARSCQSQIEVLQSIFPTATIHDAPGHVDTRLDHDRSEPANSSYNYSTFKSTCGTRRRSQCLVPQAVAGGLSLRIGAIGLPKRRR